MPYHEWCLAVCDSSEVKEVEVVGNLGEIGTSIVIMEFCGDDRLIKMYVGVQKSE